MAKGKSTNLIIERIDRKNATKAPKTTAELAPENWKSPVNQQSTQKDPEMTEQKTADTAAEKAPKVVVFDGTALREKAKTVYVTSMTGQKRSSDELAFALDAVPPANVIQLGIIALDLPNNPYTHLNIGQQSMNLRNRMRGAIKAGKLAIERVIEIRDENGFATGEEEAAKRAEAKAARAMKSAEAKAAKEAKAAARAAAKAEQSEKTEEKAVKRVRKAAKGVAATAAA